MHYLIIDTCTWINLGQRETKLLQIISDLANQGNLKLILPEIVIEEWERHKNKISDSKRESIRGQIKNAKSIKIYLPDDKKEEITRILEEFQNDEGKIEELALKEVEEIEALFNAPFSIPLPISDSAKVKAANLALAKKAPFGSQNSMADALILLSAVEYVNQEHLANSIFVSGNFNDFASTEDRNKLHPDLQELLDSCRMKYFSNIGLAIEEVKNNTVSSEEIDEIDKQLLVESLNKDILNAVKRLFVSPTPNFDKRTLQAMENFSNSMKIQPPEFDKRTLETIENFSKNTALTVPLFDKTTLEAIERFAKWINGNRF